MIPRLRHGRGEHLREEEIRAMWSLRSSLVRLKPDRDVDRTWSRFRATVAASRSVGRLLDADKRVLAMLTLRVTDTEFEGRPIRLLLGGYGFADRALRGHPMVATMYGATMFAGMRWRSSAHQRQFFCSLSYPSSTVRLAATPAPVLMPGLAGLGPLERFVLDEARDRIAGEDWDEARGAANLETIPEPLSRRWLERHADDPIARHYFAQLPDWAEGFALPTAIEVRIEWLPYIGRMMVQRVASRLRRHIDPGRRRSA